MKNKKMIMMAVVVAAILALVAIISRPDAYDRKLIGWAIESKEQIYDIYKNNTKNIINSSKVEDNVSIADSSRVAIAMAIGSLDEYHRDQITKKGNDKLNEVIEEATISLNNAIPIVLNSENHSYEDYKTISRGIDDDVVNDYISDENKELYHSVKSKYVEHEKAERLEEDKKEQEKNRQVKSAVRTGQSEGEVKALFGYPDNTYKSSEAEFWVYGDVVLTMKNGYVYDVHYSD